MRRIRSLSLAIVCVVAQLATSHTIFAQPIETEKFPASAPATQQSTSPATTQASTSAVVSADAKILLDQLDRAYATSQPAELSAVVTGRFDVAGRQGEYDSTIQSHTDGTKFSHYFVGFGRVVSDGQSGYLYDEKKNVFATLRLTKTRPGATDIDPAIVDVLLEENPSLLLSITTEPAKLLIQSADTIATSGKDQLILTRNNDATLTFFIDPMSHRITRSVVDYSPVFARRATTRPGEASVEIRYVTPDGPAPAMSYDWRPPVSADEISLRRPLVQTSPATHPAADYRSR